METRLGPGENGAATYTVNGPRPADDAAVALCVRGIEWHLSIVRVTRVAHDLIIEIRLDGIEDCTATVHVHGRIIFGVTARDILGRTCQWLLRRGSDRHGFIEVDGDPDLPSDSVPLWLR